MTLGKKSSLVQLANEHVPFPAAARWAGVVSYDPGERGGNKTWCPFGYMHSDGGADKAFRVYPTGGYCFAERKGFSVVTLLTGAWGLSRDEAAREALDRVGYVPASYSQLWDQARRESVPDRELLAAALACWCGAVCPAWGAAQYDREVAALVARCLALLPLVTTEGEAVRWLAACRQVLVSRLAA